jgi:hypothetical protein
MTQEEKLTRALDHVEELMNLMDGNEYQTYFYRNLIPIQVELERQLNLLTNTNPYSKMEE